MGTLLAVIQGDVTELKVDAIVHSTGTSRDIHSALEHAVSNRARTVAIPDSGLEGHLEKEAARVTLETVREFIGRQPGILTEVIFVCWDPKNYHLYTEMLGGENRLV